MIRNVIFDMGNVLINFDPAHFVQRAGITDPQDAQMLLREVFSSHEWEGQDRGDLAEAQVEEGVLARLPERLHDAAHRLIFAWDDPIEPIAGIEQLIRDCKAAGMGVYLLSNASVRQPEYWNRVPGHELFDGVEVSAFLRMVKPDPRIFQYVLDKYHLNAGECLFVDDSMPNVTGAESVGMHGHHFRGDTDALRRCIFSGCAE